MTKESLKVGDRVAFYCGERRIGTISAIDEQVESLAIKAVNGNTWFHVHPAQCRHLRPKKKPLRVECQVEWILDCDKCKCVRPFGMDHLWVELNGKRGTLTFVEEVNYAL